MSRCIVVVTMPSFEEDPLQAVCLLPFTPAPLDTQKKPIPLNG